MSKWFKDYEAEKWLGKDLKAEAYRKAGEIVQNQCWLECAAHLMARDEVWGFDACGYIERVNHIMQDPLKSHEAALMLVYLNSRRHKPDYDPFENPYDIMPISLTDGQLEVAEKRRKEIIYYLEDLIYYIQLKPDFWWYKCLCLSFAMDDFKKAREENQKTQ